MFEALWQRLTLAQRGVLRAVVLQGGRELLSADTRARHRLGGPSSIQAGLAALQKQDLVMKEGATARGDRLALPRVGRAEDVLTGWLARIGLDRPELRAWAMYDWANSAFWCTIVLAVFPPFFADYAAAGLRRRWRRRGLRGPRPSRSRSWP